MSSLSLENLHLQMGRKLKSETKQNLEANLPRSQGSPTPHDSQDQKGSHLLLRDCEEGVTISCKPHPSSGRLCAKSEGGRTLRGPLAESGPQPHLWHYCLLAYWWSIWTAGGNGHLTAIAPSGGEGIYGTGSQHTWSAMTILPRSSGASSGLPGKWMKNNFLK